MLYQKPFIILAVLVFGAFLVFSQLALANPHLKPCNKRLRKCLKKLTAKNAQIDDLQEEIADKDDQITGLRAEIDDLQSKALVPEAGQTTSCYSGDDGEWRMGATWPEPRFTSHNNGTVTDNLAGKVWLQNANHGPWSWEDALDFCNSLADDSTNLTDGFLAGDWHLRNVRVLQSLIDYGGSQYSMLAAGHPFTGLPSSGLSTTLFYWSSTSQVDQAGNCSSAWGVSFENSFMYHLAKTSSYFVWCAHGGQ